MKRMTHVMAAMVLAVTLPLAACSVSVTERTGDNHGDVDIRTPFGGVEVRATDTAPDTGLPQYPGSVLLRDGDRPEGARVNVGAFGFGVRVAAASFESVDDEGSILAFYRQAMAQYGEVMECRGNVDFKDRGAVCTSSASSGQVQLATGTKGNQHIVVVKPRGDTSEIAIVHVELRGIG